MLATCFAQTSPTETALRFVSFEHANTRRYGAVLDTGIVDLSTHMPEYTSLRAVLEAGALIRAGDVALGESASFDLNEVKLLPPVPDPQKIICIGVNYINRNAEYKDGTDAPDYPSIFMRTRESLVGHLSPILRPPESEQLDYEGEIAVVIGKSGRRIARNDALAHIAGITLMNEGSIRDWLRHSKFNVTQGKNFEASGSMGPWLVTAEEIEDFENLEVSTRVNGEVRQHDTTANLAFSFAYLIEYVSTFMHLQPGDVISTGTPTGAGARFEPPKWLVPGDVVEVICPAVGTLTNSVEDETV
jgi:5-carboxymethyl-2-hydroxymuconate isomerase